MEATNIFWESIYRILPTKVMPHSAYVALYYGILETIATIKKEIRAPSRNAPVLLYLVYIYVFLFIYLVFQNISYLASTAAHICRPAVFLFIL